MRDLTNGAAPGLDGLLGRLARLSAAYEQEAADLAGRIGSEQLGALRPLATACECGGSCCEFAARSTMAQHYLRHAWPRWPASPRTAWTPRRSSSRIRALAAASAELAAVREAAERLVAEEEQRLLALPWQLLHASPAGACALGSGDLSVYGDIARRVAAGERWTTKRMRQRSGYLWRMLTRASTNATPRGWLSHVSLLPVGQQGGWPGCGAASAAGTAPRQSSPTTSTGPACRAPRRKGPAATTTSSSASQLWYSPSRRICEHGGSTGKTAGSSAKSGSAGHPCLTPSGRR